MLKLFKRIKKDLQNLKINRKDSTIKLNGKIVLFMMIKKFKIKVKN